MNEKKSYTRRIKEWFKNLFKIASTPEMSILPGQIAFFIVLAIIPLISLVGIMGNMLSLSMETITIFIQTNFPTDISEIIVPIVGGEGLDVNMAFFLIISFLIASNGSHSIILASNMIYERQAHKNWLSRRMKSIILTILIILLFIFVLLIPVFGDRILNIVDQTNLVSDTIFNQFSFIYLVLKWPLSFFFIFIIIKLVYTIAPDKQIKSKHVNYGAIWTSLSWIVVTFVYSYYVSHFAYYDIFYGALSNIIILMFWIYLLSFNLVFGMSLNSNFYHLKYEEEETKSKEKADNK